MKTVEKGNFVKVCYTAKLETGEIVDHTESCQPIEVEVGAGDLIQGFEEALLGMAQNEKKTVTLTPEQAYGARDEELEQSFARTDLPPDFDPKVGEIVVIENPEGGQMFATVKRLENGNLVVDLNHPLAGKTLVFDLEVAEINTESSPSPSTCGSGCCCQ